MRLYRKSKHFFQNDAISRVRPSKAEFVMVKSASGVKEAKQNSDLVLTVTEAYKEFKTQHSDLTIGKSKFAD